MYDIKVLYVECIVSCVLLMVKSVKYYNCREFIKKKEPYVVLIIGVLVMSIILYDIPVGILAIGIIYALSGIVTTLKSKM